MLSLSTKLFPEVCVSGPLRLNEVSLCGASELSEFRDYISYLTTVKAQRGNLRSEVVVCVRERKRESEMCLNVVL